LPGPNIDVLCSDNSKQIGKKEEGTYGHRHRVRMHLQIVLDHNQGLGKLILSERKMKEKRYRPWPHIIALPIAIRVSRSASSGHGGRYAFRAARPPLKVSVSLPTTVFDAYRPGFCRLRAILCANASSPCEPFVGTGSQYTRSISSVVRCMRWRT